MFKNYIVAPALLALLALLMSGFMETVGNLSVQVENVAPARGIVRLAVFASESDFKKQENARCELQLSPRETGSTLDFQLPPLPAGTYTVAVYHDLNGNGRLDTNLFGIPNEPYAFSKEPPTKWRAPRWPEISFDYDGTPRQLRIRLRTWGER